MFDAFMGSDLFYLLFGLSYLFLVYMVYVYMKELEKLSFEMTRLNMRIDILKEKTEELIKNNGRGK